MQNTSTYALAVACSAGGFKGVFAHGVLSALEEAGIRANAYAAASSSAFPSICAVSGVASEIALRYWRFALETAHQPGNGMSETVLASINEADPVLLDNIFLPEMPRYFIATSAVTSAEAAEQTQGDGARRLGRRLLIQAARHDRSWAEQHLAPHLFDSAATEPAYRLTRSNIGSVVYASTRMLHAWTIPAWVDDRPYIDASYTCICPAIELAERGYRTVIAISNEPGPLYRDLFQREQVPSAWNGATIHLIQPEHDVAPMGADFTDATEEGMQAVYAYGLERGRAFIAKEF